MPRRNVQGPRLNYWLGVATGLLLGAVFVLSRGRDEDPELERYREVREFVQASYVRDVDSRELLDRALHALVEGLDPYSRYYDARQVAGLRRETTGRFRGVGIIFRAPVDEGRVLFPLPDSPAERAGVQVGDQVLAVDGRPLVELAPGELQGLLADQERPMLRLELHGLDGRTRVVAVERDVIVDPTVRHARLLDPERGLGYLAIVSFSQETPGEFDRAVRGLQQAGLCGLIVDVRGNLGGVLGSAVQVANRFMRRGAIVSTEGRGEVVEYAAEPDRAHFQGLPLVVLVDEDSASASEVFAAALQDHRLAVVVGSPTYGKGMVQKMRAFDDGQAEVKLTTAYYYTPTHRNLERTVADAWEFGLQPDVAVALTRLERERIHDHLASYGPPPAALEALRAWEQSEGQALIEEHPSDAQLEAAAGLFRGERPGAFALAGNG
jgi:carboxyl-terminal processing protease